MKTPIVLATLVTALALTSCSSAAEPSPTPSPSTTAAPEPAASGDGSIPTGAAGVPEGGIIDPATVDGMNADAVTDAVITTMETTDTRIDLSPIDGDRRAVEWLTPDYAALVTAPMMGGGGAVWLELEKHDGYTTVTSIVDATTMGQPEDTATEAYRSREVTIASSGRDGWTGEDVVRAYFVFLVRADEVSPWLVNEVTLG